MKFRHCFILFFFTCLGSIAVGQQLSGAMKFFGAVNPKDSNSISISYSNFFYIRDYEYFDEVQEGYTLFGTWQYPRLTIQPNKWLKLEGGALVQEEFGDKAKASPIFSVQIENKGLRILMGALEGNQSHDLIEPLMSHDKVIERPIEEGFQARYKNKRIATDFWLDWEIHQDKNSSHPEQLTGGLSTSVTLTNPDKPFQVKIPLQFIVPHQGGQLDTNHSVVTTVINHAKGLWLEWNNPDKKNWLRQVRTDGYHVGFHHDPLSTLYPFNKGHGVLVNFFLRSKWDISFLATYWNGHKYIAPKGGYMYQSISYFNQGVVEPSRKLLYLSLLYEKELFPGFFADARFTPDIDIGKHNLQYAFLIYLSYRGNFRIGTLKR